MLKLSIIDNGVGIPADRLVDLGQRVVDSTKDHSGSALFNIKERLTALFGQEATFHIESEIGQGTYVAITLPLRI